MTVKLRTYTALTALGAPLLAAAIIAVGTIFFASDPARVAAEDAPATHKLFVPAAGCDSCGSQPVRLYYLGMRQDSAPLDDRRVRRALWWAVSPTLLASGVDVPGANVGLAASVITPNRPSSYETFIGGSVIGCDTGMWEAGYPTLQDARRLVLPIDVADNDPVAVQLGQALDKQWLRCEAGLVLRYHSPHELQRLIATGQSQAFITTVDASTAEPFSLLHRLYELDSPENFTDVEPADPSRSIQPLLELAANVSDPLVAEAIYTAIVDQTTWRIPDYLNVLPLAWRYDIDGLNPPHISLGGPFFGLVTTLNPIATISGSVQPGEPGKSIVSTTVDWGDGTIEEAILPASHRYAPNTSNVITRTIMITAKQSDGSRSWRIRWLSHSR